MTLQLKIADPELIDFDHLKESFSLDFSRYLAVSDGGSCEFNSETSALPLLNMNVKSDMKVRELKRLLLRMLNGKPFLLERPFNDEDTLDVMMRELAIFREANSLRKTDPISLFLNIEKFSIAISKL